MRRYYWRTVTELPEEALTVWFVLLKAPPMDVADWLLKRPPPTCVVLAVCVAELLLKEKTLVEELVVTLANLLVSKNAPAAGAPSEAMVAAVAAMLIRVRVSVLLIRRGGKQDRRTAAARTLTQLVRFPEQLPLMLPSTWYAAME